MQSFDTGIAADRFTETLTMSFRNGAGQSSTSPLWDEYFLPKSGDLISIEIRGRSGYGRVALISIDGPRFRRHVAMVAGILAGDATFVDPGQRVGFVEGDILSIFVDQDQDTNEGEFCVEVTVQMSYPLVTT